MNVVQHLKNDHGQIEFVYPNRPGYGSYEEWARELSKFHDWLHTEQHKHEHHAWPHVKPLSTWAEEGEEGPEQLTIPGLGEDE
jgi:hypothetical protein